MNVFHCYYMDNFECPFRIFQIAPAWTRNLSPDLGIYRVRLALYQNTNVRTLSLRSKFPASFQLAHQPKELSCHVVFKVILQPLGLAAKLPYYLFLYLAFPQLKVFCISFLIPLLASRCQNFLVYVAQLWLQSKYPTALLAVSKRVCFTFQPEQITAIVLSSFTELS